jgi:uncharacterized protein (DUF983 family)
VAIFKKGTKVYSIFKGKCPKCHEGEFFKYKFTFNPSKITQLHNNCPKCGLKYMIEPSFFYGAMYVNYALTTALSIITFLIAKLVFNLSLLQSFAAIFIALVVLAPFNLRLSRLLWINMFVSYKSKNQ